MYEIKRDARDFVSRIANVENPGVVFSNVSVKHGRRTVSIIRFGRLTPSCFRQAYLNSSRSQDHPIDVESEDDDSSGPFCKHRRRLSIVAIPDEFLVAFEHSKHAWTIRVGYDSADQAAYICNLRDPLTGEAVPGVASSWNKTPTRALIQAISRYNEEFAHTPDFKTLATRGPNGAILVGLTYANVQARLVEMFRSTAPVSPTMADWMKQTFVFEESPPAPVQESAPTPLAGTKRPMPHGFADGALNHRHLPQQQQNAAASAFAFDPSTCPLGVPVGLNFAFIQPPFWPYGMPPFPATRPFFGVPLDLIKHSRG